MAAVMDTRRPVSLVDFTNQVFGDLQSGYDTARRTGLAARMVLLQGRFLACAREARKGNEPPAWYRRWLEEVVQELQRQPELRGLRMDRSADGHYVNLVVQPQTQFAAAQDPVEVPSMYVVEWNLREGDFWSDDAFCPNDIRHASASRIPQCDFSSEQGMRAWFDAMADRGLLFHPDDRPEEVVTGLDGRRVFTDAECADLKSIMRELFTRYGDTLHGAALAAGGFDEVDEEEEGPCAPRP